MLHTLCRGLRVLTVCTSERFLSDLSVAPPHHIFVQQIYSTEIRSHFRHGEGVGQKEARNIQGVQKGGERGGKGCRENFNLTHISCVEKMTWRNRRYVNCISASTRFIKNEVSRFMLNTGKKVYEQLHRLIINS